MTAEEHGAGPVERTLLLLIRHAEQQTMRELDPPLSERGRLQAERLGKRLAGLPITAVVSSPLRRARSTAEPTARAHGLDVAVHPDLAEVRFEADAMRETFSNTSAGAMEPDPDDYVRSAMAAVHVVPRFVWGGPGAVETGDALRARATSALADIVAGHPGGVVACFTHGGFLCAALGSWLGLERDMWFVPWHTGISAVMVTATEKIVLTVNDVAHLAPDEDVLNVAAHNLDHAADGGRP